MKTNWILVANQAEAQIYSSGQIPKNLMLVDTLVNETGRTLSRDMVSDAPGRAFDRFGGARHAIERHMGAKQEPRRRFVKELVERLEKAHLHGDFDQLVLVAAPAVLGVIRKTLPTDLVHSVVKEIPKDVIGQSVDKIQSQLDRAFALV